MTEKTPEKTTPDPKSSTKTRDPDEDTPEPKSSKARDEEKSGKKPEENQPEDAARNPEQLKKIQDRGEDPQAGNAITNPGAAGDAAPTRKQPGKQDFPKGQREGEINAESTWTDEEGYEFDLTDGSDEYREKLHKDGKI